MTNSSNDQLGYIDFSNTVVDYKDGDVVMFDHVDVLSKAYPLKPKTTLLAFCSQGQITLTVNGKTLEFVPGDVFVCPPNVKVEKSVRGEKLDCKAIGLSDHIIQALLRDKMETWNHMVYINQVYKITLGESCEKDINLYYMLLQSKLQSKRRVPSYYTLQSLLRALLLDLCAELEEIHGTYDDLRPSQGKMLFNRFLSMISNNEVKRQPIAVYADLLAITPKYLTLLCLKYSNKTASDWVIQYTCEDIRFYLRNSNLSIKEISAKLGFANMSHFGSYVRKHMGMSPSEFRHKK
jgi:AraC-like DNA-binding protein